METLSLEEISKLTLDVANLIPDRMYNALIDANRKGKLEDLLKLMKMDELIPVEEKLDTFSNGKIYVIGQVHAKITELYGVARNLNIDKERFVFVDFYKSKTFNYRIFDGNITVAAILFGAMPHKSSGTNDASSVINFIEKHRERFPYTVRMQSNNKLKITKSNFKACLENLLKHGIIE